MLNKSFILERIDPFLNQKKQISENEFLILFSDLELKEQYEIINIMISEDIEYVIEKNDENHEVNNPISPFIKNNVRPYDYTGLLELSNEHLCVMYQKGDSEALMALIEKNKRFVYSIAIKAMKQFNQTSLTIDDIVQEAYIGIMEAAKRFDVEKDFKFLTYAWHWIRQRIQRSIIDTGYIIRIPVHMFEKIIKINRYRINNLHVSLNHLYESFIEINSGVGMDENTFNNCVMYSELLLNTTSLNMLVNETEDSELIEFIPILDEKTTEDIVMQKQLKEDIEKVIESLNENEKEVINSRFGLQTGFIKTLEEIGKERDVTRERIRQIEAKGLKKLRSRKSVKLILKDYWEE